MNYNFKDIEAKWQREWNATSWQHLKKPTREKYYCLDMFPYPSGSGLHVGHWRSYVLSDIYARRKWLEGYELLHPMGWDAFGLPAENDALKKGVHPAQGTANNIANFKTQLKKLAALYDWDKEINTTDPDYYKWTQWIFLQLYKANLAYESNMPINWCSSCLTGLANEEVVNAACERCGTPVEQKQIRQWVLKITEYAQKLLDGLDTLEWPEKVKAMQRHWIGRSEGTTITFQATNAQGNATSFEVYTTRPETMFGISFIAMAPDHTRAHEFTTAAQEKEVLEYQDQVKMVSSFNRTVDKEKTGVFSGCYAINPLTEVKIPIFFASYVLADYGTGIVQGVPAHDERDFDFAVLHNLPRLQVIQPFHETDQNKIHESESSTITECWTDDGILVNSGSFNGFNAKTDGRKNITQHLVDQKIATISVTYKLRDWIFSRQRYWGEPIPLIHCKQCGVVPVPEDQLPVLLPDVERYEPTGTGESPLAAIEQWVNTQCPTCKSDAKRETNTMPQWAGSCWYFLRYPNPHLQSAAWDINDMNKWLPVDLYVGGIEHAVLHLLYARFWTKVLYDQGYLPFNEPFKQLFNQGMVLKYSEKSGLIEKMSKSKGNVVNPDDIVEKYGSDVLRMYILFMGPPELDCEWQDSGLEGIRRFANKLWNYLSNAENHLTNGQIEADIMTKSVHKLLMQFDDRLTHFKPNTAISAFMEWVNEGASQEMKISKDSLKKICEVLSIIAPHMASELLETFCRVQLYECSWPDYDPLLAQNDEATIVLQVNGKVRAQLQARKDSAQSDIEPQATKILSKWLEEKQVIKIIFVANKLINFVIK